MPCCMSDALGWCASLPVEYNDGQGHEFCIFHAPQGKKGCTTEEFNKTVFLYIDTQKERNERCNLMGTIFDGYIDFSNYHEENALHSITFNRSVFPFGVSFSESVFAKGVGFAGIKVSGEADFGGAIFRERASFLSAIFSMGADFSSVKFENEAVFSKAKLSGLVKFLHSRFDGSANFNGAELHDDIYLDNAIFQNKTSFTATVFHGRTSFSKVVFLSHTDFSDAAFDDRVDFSSASFGDTADFTLATFKARAFFEKTAFNGNTLFRRVNLEGVTFDSVDFGKVSFLDANLRKADLVLPLWPRKNGRNLIYDETTAQTEEEIRRVGLLYRMLKQKFKEEHDETEASNWHYGEKEMYRKSKKFRRFFPLTLSNLYWFSSGYGERPIRAALVLTSAVLIASFLSAFFGLVCVKEPCYGITRIGIESPYCPQWHLVGATLLNMLSYVTFQKESLFTPATQWGYLIKVASQIFIPLQTALLVLAVRNRFRR